TKTQEHAKRFLRLVPHRNSPPTPVPPFYLPIQIVDCLSHRVPELSRCILSVAYYSIRRALIGHLVVAGKSSYTLLDRACERSHLPPGSFLRAPAKGFAGRALDPVVPRRIVRF